MGRLSFPAEIHKLNLRVTQDASRMAWNRQNDNPQEPVPADVKLTVQGQAVAEDGHSKEAE